MESRVLHFLQNNLNDMHSLENISNLISKLTQKLVVKKFDLEKNEEEISRKLDDDSKLFATLHELESGLGIEVEKSKVLTHAYDFGKTKNRIKNAKVSLKKINELLISKDYLLFLQKIDALNSNLRANILLGEYSSAVDLFLELKDLEEALISNTPATHAIQLKRFLSDSLLHWYKCLYAELCVPLNDALSSIGWPFLASSHEAALDQFLSKEDTYSLMKSVLKLQTIKNTGFSRNDANSHYDEYDADEGGAEKKDNNYRKISSPKIAPMIQVLVRPFARRFVYHFYGNKATNNIGKPEWFFIQVLQWIKASLPIVEDSFAPKIKECLKEITTHHPCHKICLNVRDEFIRGLVLLARDKVLHDLLIVFEKDESLFLSYASQIISFHKSLQVYEYPDTFESCVDVIIEKPYISKWLYLEKNFLHKKLNAIISSPESWNPVEEDNLNGLLHSTVESVKSSLFSQSLLILLQDCSEKYDLLIKNGKEVLLFFDVQLQILEQFRTLMIQVLKDSSFVSLRIYCITINTLYHISSVLSDWTLLPHYIKIGHLLRQRSKIAENVENTEDTFDGPFEECIRAYSSSLDLIQRELIESLVSEIDDLLYEYKCQRWMLSIEKNSTNEIVECSDSLRSLLKFLQAKLSSFHHYLSLILFKKVTIQILKHLDTLLLNDIILVNKFSSDKVLQFEFDVRENLLKLFFPYILQPESYFKKSVSAIRLLKLDLKDVKQIVQYDFDKKTYLFSLDQYHDRVSAKIANSHYLKEETSSKIICNRVDFLNSHQISILN